MWKGIVYIRDSRYPTPKPKIQSVIIQQHLVKENPVNKAGLSPRVCKKENVSIYNPANDVVTTPCRNLRPRSLLLSIPPTESLEPEPLVHERYVILEYNWQRLGLMKQIGRAHV